MRNEVRRDGGKEGRREGGMWCSARFGSHYSSSVVWKTLVVTNSHEGDKEMKVANEQTLMLKTSCSDRLTPIREREQEKGERG